jgi:hypothetical protein
MEYFLIFSEGHRMVRVVNKFERRAYKIFGTESAEI